MQITTERTNLPATQPGFFTGITVRMQNPYLSSAVIIEREGYGDALVFSRSRARRGMTPVFRRSYLGNGLALAWFGLPTDGPVSEIRWGAAIHGVARWADKPGTAGTYTTYDSEYEAYVELGLMFIS